MQTLRPRSLNRQTAAPRPGFRAAVDAKCKDCIHDPAAPGTWREQVALCSSINCALWPLRPAPSGGRFADPPRDALSVTPAWIKAPAGLAYSGHRVTVVTHSPADGQPDEVQS